MSEVTRQIAGLTNELESLLPRARYIRDRPTNAPPAGCSDDSALSTVASMVDSARWQDPHVLHVTTPFPERVVGQPEVHGGKQLLPEAVAGEGSRLAHQ